MLHAACILQQPGTRFGAALSIHNGPTYAIVRRLCHTLGPTAYLGRTLIPIAYLGRNWDDALLGIKTLPSIQFPLTLDCSLDHKALNSRTSHQCQTPVPPSNFGNTSAKPAWENSSKPAAIWKWLNPLPNDHLINH